VVLACCCCHCLVGGAWRRPLLYGGNGCIIVTIEKGVVRLDVLWRWSRRDQQQGAAARHQHPQTFPLPASQVLGTLCIDHAVDGSRKPSLPQAGRNVLPVRSLDAPRNKSRLCATDAFLKRVRVALGPCCVSEHPSKAKGSFNSCP